MKVVVQVKLMPDAVQVPALERTPPAANDAANWVSAISFDRFGLKGSVRDLRKLCCGELKARGFGAQAAQRIIKRVVDAYTTLRANIERVTVSRDQRARQSSWPFHRLGSFLEYKARRAGVPFIEVDPAYTSQRCPRCSHTEKANRLHRDHFQCRRCGLAGPADHVAGVNIANKLGRYSPVVD